MLKNFEKHNLTTCNSSNNSKNNKEKKNQSRKRQKDPEDTNADSYQTEGGQYCSVTSVPCLEQVMRKLSHTPPVSAKLLKLQAMYHSSGIKNGKKYWEDKNSRKRRKTYCEINAMEVDSSDYDKEQKNSHLFEEYFIIMMNEFKKRKTDYDSDSSWLLGRDMDNKVDTGAEGELLGSNKNFLIPLQLQ